MVGAHVPLQCGKGGEVAAAVAGDVGGRLDADPVHGGDGGGDGEAGHGRGEGAKLVKVVEPSWGEKAYRHVYKHQRHMIKTEWHEGHELRKGFNDCMVL